MIKKFLKKLLLLSWAHKILILTSVLIIAVASIGIYQFNNFQNNRQKTLDSFLAKQQEKKSDLQKTYDQIIKDSEKEEQETQKLADEIDKNFKVDLPDCSKLKGRANIIITSNNCDYKLKALGETNLAVVLVTDPSLDQSPDLWVTKEWNEIIKMYTNSTFNQKSLLYLDTYLKKEGKKYNVSDVGIKFTFFGPYPTVQSFPKLEDCDRSHIGPFGDIMQKTSKQNGVPEQNFDMVHYLYIGQQCTSYALRESHRAFTASIPYYQGVFDANNKLIPATEYTVGVFIHETLHLFEANDKYIGFGCQSTGKGDPFTTGDQTQGFFDIMCHTDDLNHDIINPITAREIGWTN